MIFHEIDIRGAFLIELERKEDARGFFARAWSSKNLQSEGLFLDSLNGISLHTERYNPGPPLPGPATGGKLLVYSGRDLRCHRHVRPNSPTRYRWAAIELHASEYSLLYVPGGCAHGFQSLEDDTEVVYPVSALLRTASGTRFAMG